MDMCVFTNLQTLEVCLLAYIFGIGSAIIYGIHKVTIINKHVINDPTIGKVSTYILTMMSSPCTPAIYYV